MNDAACRIGEEIQVRGNISGAGDLVVEGRVEGNVSLEDHMIVERSGIVVADVESKELTINGQMSGNVEASGRVAMAASATVTGDIRAPRVIIEDGARFRGSIEMEVPLPDDI